MQEYKMIEEELDLKLKPGENFDVIKKEIKLSYAGKAAFYYIDGFVKSDIMTKIFESVLSASSVDDAVGNIPYIECKAISPDTGIAVTKVLSGCSIMIVEGSGDIYVIDARDFPVRSISEPEKDKVLHGPHEGFTETLIHNTVMVRRRIRDENLRMELFHIGNSTKTDVVMMYLEGAAEKQFIQEISEKLSKIRVDALNLGHQSLVEMLVKRRWYNPFPKVRYTERPDAASAMIMEGRIILLCDNSPSAMILPTSVLDFLQESDDFYFPTLAGSYLRIVRLFTAFSTVFVTPLWYLLLQYPHIIPSDLAFIGIKSEPMFPVLLQILLAEIVVDGLKLASLNTPQALSNSFSVVAGLILGDFAVQVGWFVPEVILYVAFTALANYTQPSYELGYALKFMRIMLLILTGMFKIWGFIFGIAVMLVLLFTNSSISGSKGYLYPIIPWDGHALKRLLLKSRLK